MELLDSEGAIADFTDAIRLAPDRPRAYLARASARRRDGDFETAFADADKAVELAPNSDVALNLRAAIFYSLGQYREALNDHLAAAAIDPHDPSTQNFLGWLRATCPLNELRDGESAVQHATRACESSAYSQANYVDTLAAACAEVGRFPDAIRWQKKVIELIPLDDRPAAEERLKLYERGQPYRDQDEIPF